MSSPLNLSPFWLLLVLLLTVQVDGQFFTKSSKSIPRMGRRSDSSDALIALANFRRAIIDDIVDKFGPELNELVAKDKKDEKHNLMGENVDLNFQANNLERVDGAERETDEADFQSLLNGRDSRSAKNYKESSLAMRAFNTNRFLKHLASGRPLMSYDRLFAANQNRQTD